MYRVFAARLLLTGVLSLGCSDVEKGNVQRNVDEVIVDLSGNVVIAEIARTPEEKSRGLSGRSSLPRNRGMIFVFDQPGFQRFWMQGMLLPLDFIWLSGGRVVDITANVPAPHEDDATSSTFTSAKPASYVLEVNAGWVEEHSIRVGDSFEMRPVQ